MTTGDDERTSIALKKKNVGQASFSGSVDWSHLIKCCEHAYKIFYLERA